MLHAQIVISKFADVCLVGRVWLLNPSVTVTIALPEEYQELTEQEEKDLEDLLLRENAIQDAPAFMENLSEELAQLDQGNIHSLMGSEAQIRELMGHLDQAVLEIEQMEMKLTVYDELLSGVRDTMQKMGKQYSRILVENRNLTALHAEVEDLVVREEGREGGKGGEGVESSPLDLISYLDLNVHTHNTLSPE